MIVAIVIALLILVILLIVIMRSGDKSDSRQVLKQNIADNTGGPVPAPQVPRPKIGDPDWSPCIGGQFCGGLCDSGCCSRICEGTNNNCFNECANAVNIERDTFSFIGEVGIAALAAVCQLNGCNNL